MVTLEKAVELLEQASDYTSGPQHSPSMTQEIETFVAAYRASAGQAAVPEGWRLLKDSTFDERSWPEDTGDENGGYMNGCHVCGRTFLGHKRRVTCKVCASSPQPPAQSASAGRGPLSEAEIIVMGPSNWAVADQITFARAIEAKFGIGAAGAGGAG